MIDDAPPALLGEGEPDAASLDKRAWRNRARANRRGLTVDSARVTEAVRRFLDRRAADDGAPDGWVVLFDALPGEPDLSGLLADRPERRLALTRTPDQGHRLSVHDARSPLERHRFGYRQPVDGLPEIADADVAAVLVPGLAFDRHGGRLGFGAGYYDRLLARLPEGVLVVGVSDGYVVERLPTDAHDVPMTHLATEAGVMALPLDQRAANPASDLGRTTTTGATS